MNPCDLQPTKNGTGDSSQVFQLIEGNIGNTTGADNIDTSDARYIWFGTDCTIYLGTTTTKTINVTAGDIRGCSLVDSIHVDRAIDYALM